MAQETWPKDAWEYFRQGYEAQMNGNLDEAIDSYKRSLEVYPTAEAHTFLGWVYSFQGRYGDAIRECEIAIAVDEEFGNPYNDIGAYLIRLGRLDDAIPWFKKAIAAKRYQPRHYPHFNLSRVYVKQGKILEAIQELRTALRLNPEYEAARKELHRLLGMLN